MIAINKTTAQLDAFACIHQSILFGNDFDIAGLITTKLASNITVEERAYYAFIQAHLSEIIVGKPNELEILKTDLDQLYDSILQIRHQQNPTNTLKKERQKLNNEIFKIFNYGKFISYKDGLWAYELTERLNAPVCTYCNRQYTFTVKTRSGKTRPQFDHFYDKGRNPHFAISFYNLIPSCYICNSNLKGQNQFTIGNNLHPFFEDADEVLSFRINITKVDFIEGNKKNFDVLLKQHNSGVNQEILDKSIRNAEIFLLNKLYAKHKDVVVDIIKKAYYYNTDKVSELLNYTTAKGNKLFSTKTEVLESIFGNYVTKNKLGERVLSKLTKDIVDQLEVFKY
jgi:hypothetical protein